MGGIEYKYIVPQLVKHKKKKKGTKDLHSEGIYDMNKVLIAKLRWNMVTFWSMWINKVHAFLVDIFTSKAMSFLNFWKSFYFSLYYNYIYNYFLGKLPLGPLKFFKHYYYNYYYKKDICR